MGLFNVLGALLRGILQMAFNVTHYFNFSRGRDKNMTQRGTVTCPQKMQLVDGKTRIQLSCL